MKINNNLLIFWSIGKKVVFYKNKFDNSVSKLSDYYSYKYGNSYLFSRTNIINMRNFYLCFPMYISRMEYLTWDIYKLLITINNHNERMFYFYLSLFFNYSKDELFNSLNNNFFYRI